MTDKLEFFDTHCHIQGELFKDDANETVASARLAGVSNMICIGTDLAESRKAVDFAKVKTGVWASIGLHPHEASKYKNNADALEDFAKLARSDKVIAIGECGLDFYYNHSPEDAQEMILRFQIELAIKNNLPMIFHIRDSFKRFWEIFDEYHKSHKIRGVVHSFSSKKDDLEQVLARNLNVGLNGIMTFSKIEEQLAAAKAVPLDKLVLETDSPFLTPVPKRGTINKPENVILTAEFLSELRGVPLKALAKATTANAKKLFGV